MCIMHNHALPLGRKSSVYVSASVGLPTVISVGISGVHWL